MSQTSKTIKKLAASESYQALDKAIKEDDYETIVSSYIALSRQLEEAEREIAEKIQSLPRQNKDEDCEKFRAAFAVRVQASLPQWYWVDSELRNRLVMEGEVFGLGSKGDPLVRTPEGKVVVIEGTKLEPGEKIRFRVVTEGEKLNFGRVFELNGSSFYQILNEEARQGIRKSLASLREHVENYLGDTDKGSLSRLSELLTELEDVRELAASLQAEEKTGITTRLLGYRKRLLRASLAGLVLDFLARQEEREIAESCAGDEESLARALAAPGIFRRQAHEALKAELTSGEKPVGYSETVAELEGNVDSMDAALALLDFKAKIEQSSPTAERYLERIDRLFVRLVSRTNEVASHLAEDTIHDSAAIETAISDAFSDQSLSAELKRVFRSPEEFFTQRAALVKLRVMLGKAESDAAEAALKHYLSRFFPQGSRVA